MLIIDRLLIFLVFSSQVHYIFASYNVAQGKSTWQSSTGFYGPSSKAVDGNTNQDHTVSGGRCAHSDVERTEEWWCIDLKQSFDIASMKIFNRVDNDRENRLKGFEIRVSSSGHCDEAGFRSATPCYKDHTSAGLSTYTIERCNQSAVPSFSGRFVFISVKGTPAILTLCEVQIFPASYNVAQGKSTWQSSTGFYGPSSKAVDGNTNQDHSGSRCTHSDIVRTEEWWCIDLEQSFDIASIKIFNRVDSDLEKRLKGFEIRVSSSGHCDEAGFRSATPCYKDHTSVGQSTYTIERCNQSAVPSFSGRFVFISVKGTPAILTLCEVQIFPASYDVAQGKSTWQSSTGFYGPSSKAVDGNTNQHHNGSGGRCAHSDVKRTEEWWCIDLKQSFDIASMKIFNRVDNDRKNRLKGFEIRVSSSGHCDEAGFTSATPCYKDHTSVGLSTYTIERCNRAAVPSFSGRFVFISVKGTPAILTLCEVQIFPENCPLGFYGTNCNQRCPTNCANNTCGARTRKCTGCKAGYYGDVCEESCSTCNGSCRQLDGVCLTGCKDGYWGCNGLCLQTCSYCTAGGCRIEDGVCHNGCRVGFNNTKC